MATTKQSSTNIWSDSVLTYFEGLWNRDDWSAEQKARGIRVVSEPALAKLAQQVNGISDPQTIAEFLGEAVTLPEAWDNLSQRPREFHERQTLEVQRGAESFLSLIRKHRESCASLLIHATGAGSNRVAQAKENLATLERTVHALRLGATSFQWSISNLKLPRLSRKNSIRDAKLIFFLKHLTATAQESFGNPYYTAAGILAKHCLGLPVALDYKQVKDICKPSTKRPKKKG